MKRKLVVGLLVAIVLLSGVAIAAVDWRATSSVEFDAADGPAITLDEQTDLTAQRPIPDSQTVDLGPIDFESTGDTSAFVSSVSGSQTKLTGVVTNSNTLWANHSQTQRVGVDSGASTINSITWDQIDLASDQTEISISGSGTLYVDGFAANEYVRVERSGEILLRQADADGIISVTVQDHDLTFLDTNEPQLTNPIPNDNQNIDQSPVTLQADLDHPDFPAEEVTLTWYLNGQQVDTTTATDSGTVSVDVTGFVGGSNDWSVVAEDTTGATTSIEGSFATPNTLEIRDEQNPDQLVTTDTEIEVTFFGDDQTVETRTTTDGTIDMSGLPLDESFTVQVDADGYLVRQSFARSVVERQEIFVLNDSAETVETQFEVNDPTGQFPSETSRVFVKKPIERGGTTQYEVVVADQIGSGGWTTTLAKDQRYLIEVENPNTGEIRQLGPYVASVNEVVTLNVDDLNYDFTQNVGDVNFDWDATYINETGPAIDFQFVADDTIDKFDVTIHKRNNESVTILEEQFTNYNGNISLRAMIPEYIEDPDTTTWVVNWNATIDGETTDSSTIVGRGTLGTSIPGVGGTVLSIVGVLAIFVVAGLFSAANVSVGAIATSLVAAGLWFVGIIPSAVSGAFIAVALMIGIITHVQRGPQPR